MLSFFFLKLTFIVLMNYPAFCEWFTCQFTTFSMSTVLITATMAAAEMTTPQKEYYYWLKNSQMEKNNWLHSHHAI